MNSFELIVYGIASNLIYSISFLTTSGLSCVVKVVFGNIHVKYKTLECIKIKMKRHRGKISASPQFQKFFSTCTFILCNYIIDVDFPQMVLIYIFFLFKIKKNIEILFLVTEKAIYQY